MGGAGGAAAPPIIETVRVLRGVSAPPKILALRVLHPQYFNHNYLADDRRSAPPTSFTYFKCPTVKRDVILELYLVYRSYIDNYRYNVSSLKID